MTGRASRRKGAGGEREVAKIFAAHNLNCYRTPNSGGLSIPGDIVGIHGYCFEVKRQERLAIPAWLRQAHAAARDGTVPVLVFRRNNDRGGDPVSRWHAVLPLEDLAYMLAATRDEWKVVA